MKRISLLAVLCVVIGVTEASAEPVYLDDQFEMPAGFRIYRVADSSLTGGTYDVAFDGEGRLLVGDGKAVRRLRDDNGDGVLDHYDVIAEGLGGRGPQGLLVYGDRLYAVGGDGVQLFEGYRSEQDLKHVGRIGETFHTGGDHAAHTVLRGHDGHVYFITGDGGGASERIHITETNSPVIYERNGSVFRVSPDGARWECVSAGGRNAPNLGMNYLGEMFSWDSDMEWHVDLPWYRPLRLNHWVQGGDQGWQSVGAYPPYYVDAASPVMDTGRGSPTWGVFYEHDQFPKQYQDAYFVCDYRWKSATSGGYNRAGRLVAFSLKRDGAGWKSTMEVFLRPKPGAVDANRKPINFGLVDVDVAPDGSIFISDHNQGVWRVVYDPQKKSSPSWEGRKVKVGGDVVSLANAAIAVPQKASEWGRLQVQNFKRNGGEEFDAVLRRIALNADRSLRDRLNAVRLLAPGFASLDAAFLQKLAGTNEPELRGQAIWLDSLSGRHEMALGALTDKDPFVRRRAAEALNRSLSSDGVSSLVEALGDKSRLVQYASMTALSHRPVSFDWLVRAGQDVDKMVRVLVAAHLSRQELPEGALNRGVATLLSKGELTPLAQLDVLRVLGLFRNALMADADMKKQVEDYLLSGFPGSDRRVRWEQARLIGEYGVSRGFGALVTELEKEKDEVTQFHLAQAISRLESGWDSNQALRLKGWFLTTQKGWFSNYAGKGRQFPGFWETVLNDYAGKHAATLAADLEGIDLGGALGRIVLSGVAMQPGGGPALIKIYGGVSDPVVKRRILETLGNARRADVAAFLRAQYALTTDDQDRSAILNSLSRMPREKANQLLLTEGLGHPDAATVVSLGRALIGYRAPIDQSIADDLMRQLNRKTELTPRISTVLIGLSKVKPRPRFSERTDRNEIVAYWMKWYEDQYQVPFGAGEEAVELKSNKALEDFMSSDQLAGGNAAKGKEVYVKAQCARCHGGVGEETVLFGPDLAGVTQRLQRKELVEAIIYPSKTVAERFQATEIELKDGEPLTGFITDRSGGAVTIALQDRVEKVEESNVESITPQVLSLMPEGLLNVLSWDEIKDLYAYIAQLGSN